MEKYNGYMDSVKTEFAERVFSSRKRVIKFIAICFVPFLYAFICIWAFWNPIPKIGEAPMAIVSNDTKINFVVGKSSISGKLAVGEAYAYKNSSGEIIIIDADFDIGSLVDGTEIITSAGTIIVKDSGMIYNKTSLVDNLVDSWKQGSVENVKYNQNTDKFSIKVNESMTLSNLKFLNGANAEKIAIQNPDGSWKVKDESKYWAQVQMPTSLSSNIIGFFDASVQRAFHLDTEASQIRAPSDFLSDLKQNSMQFWSTYKHNFLFGQFMYIFNEFKSSLLVDIGPEVIGDLISIIIQNSINDVRSQLVFMPTENSRDTFTISDHGSSVPHKVTLTFIKGQEYVVRNQEMITLISQAHPTWTVPQMSIEGTTGTNINQDWGTDGFLSVLANRWNDLMQGENGNLIATDLANSITKKINNEIPSGSGTLAVDSDGIKKLFASAGNIAGLLEQNGRIIPNDSSSGANFPITGDGSIANLITDYKSLIINSENILNSKFNLVSILSSNSKSSESSYILPFGELTNPKTGTFNYNWQHDIKVIMHLIFGKGNSQSVGSLALASFLPDLNDFLKTTIVGSQFNPYGIGLGQFFLCIGIWVGTLMQTFVYDRAKRIKNAKPWAWYLSKTTLMLVTAWIQTTILMLSVYFLGWSVIGPAFGLVYLWMMFTATVFVIIQQALWFSVQDETVGKFLVIILLIINLSAGWGTFPTFMQAPIFNVLSYIAPYTYSIHGQGAIIYSIAVNGINLADTLYVLQQFGILLVWIVGFLIIGLLSSLQRNRDMLYGTHNSKKLGTILMEEKLNKYVNTNTKRAIWKKLPKEEMPEIRKKVKRRYPEEGQYEWYKRWKSKNHHKPLTASESDDEVMRRND